MLTARLGRLRDWALFTAAALAPAAAVGVLGLRALANEEAGQRREAALELAAAAGNVKREIEQGVARAAGELGALAIDADPVAAGAALGRVAPRFAVPVLLAPDRSFLVPAPASLRAGAAFSGGLGGLPPIATATAATGRRVPPGARAALGPARSAAKVDVLRAVVAD